MNYRDKYKDESWYPVLVDKKYIERIRNDYPFETKNLSDEEVAERYNESYGKYATLWDNVGDAYHDYEGLADAFFELLGLIESKYIFVEEKPGKMSSLHSVKCRCCKKRDFFTDHSRYDAIKSAINAGWMLDNISWICSDCGEEK